MSGLVGFWSLAEQSGRANDLSGNGNHGNVNGATQGVWGRGGLTAYSFDGSDDYIDCGDILFSQISDGPFTFSVWARKNGTGSDQSALNYKGGNAGLGYERRGSNGWEYFHYDGSAQVIESGDTSTDEWIHLVAVFDGSVINFYLNNQHQGTESAGSLTSNSVNMGIGGDPRGNNLFNGYVTDVRIYNRALSPQEIQTLYEWGSEDYTPQSLHDGTDSGAVSRYTFDGNVTTDAWGSNTLTDNTSAGTTTDAIRGDAKSFDGTDDYMDTALIISGGATTFSAWVNLDDLSGSDNRIIGDHQSSNGQESFLDARNNEVSFRYFLSDGESTETQLAPETQTNFVSEGVSYHVCGVYNGSDTARLYVNGTLNDSVTDSSFNGYDPDNEIRIGARASDSTIALFDGDIDDVRIYDRALSDREVFDLYRWGARGKDMRKEMVTK